MEAFICALHIGEFTPKMRGMLRVLKTLSKLMKQIHRRSDSNKPICSMQRLVKAKSDYKLYFKEFKRIIKLKFSCVVEMATNQFLWNEQ